MFRFALARDLVLRNPLDTVAKRDVGDVDVDRDRVLTTEKIRQLGASIEASGLHERFAAGIWLILSTGVRVGELLGAAWFDERRSRAGFAGPTSVTAGCRSSARRSMRSVPDFRH